MSITPSFRELVESSAFHPPQASYYRHQARLFFIRKKKLKIACMMYSCNKNNTDKIILYSHGNGSDIGLLDEYLVNLCKNLNTNIISYDYEGYGLTTDDKNIKLIPSFEGCKRTILKVYNYLLAHNYKQIYLFGKSIGSYPSIYLASLNLTNIKGLFLQSPFCYVYGVMYTEADKDFYVILDEEDKKIFSNNISEVKCPITIIHGNKDELIPVKHSLLLKDSNTNTRLIILQGGRHNNLELDYYYDIVSALSSMIDV
jgi:pimeloyl-ACP methyl ester carboxylesterase